jgi:protein-tyrosine-phosphatase
MRQRPKILVVSTKNAGRSVAARVVLDHRSGDRVVAGSAGTRPGDTINPVIASILAEQRMDASKQFPEPLEDEVARTADIIVTMGCGDACPAYPGPRHLDWELTDPTGKTLDEVRPIVDKIERSALALLGDLDIESDRCVVTTRLDRASRVSVVVLHKLQF